MKKFQHKYTLPAILTLLVLAISGILIGFFNFQRQTTLPPDSNPSAIGVELNQSLGYVDLHKLQDNGVSFVYLKATQGRSYFDDDFLSYRDQILGTKLAYGCIINYSNESTANQHYRYFNNKVGKNTGTLPVLLEPTSSKMTQKYLHSMSKFVKLLQLEGKQVMVEVAHKYYKIFPTKTLFMATSDKSPNKLKYSFWKYTSDGRVKDVDGLENGATMFTYNGTVQQYRQRYGQLTQ
ncbi:GH25 family lysozyme [Lactobacillus sp. LL6]|uniref:GH25 family lysozyme n=1 Tax=Lactobacillus sp. LL6 TaxID=2596827 RepID=UPI00118687A0|nr:GH25 family lysozyme [Lactobacillus sp. LL6]TSO26654.1 lysozyme [Lactobacillus sp. LL6]